MKLVLVAVLALSLGVLGGAAAGSEVTLHMAPAPGGGHNISASWSGGDLTALAFTVHCGQGTSLIPWLVTVTNESYLDCDAYLQVDVPLSPFVYSGMDLINCSVEPMMLGEWATGAPEYAYIDGQRVPLDYGNIPVFAPEPTSFTLIGMAALALIRRRR